MDGDRCQELEYCAPSRLSWQGLPTASKGWHELPSSGQNLSGEHLGGNVEL